MRLICPKCKHEWDYQGNNPFYAYCPICHSLVSIRKHAVDKPVQKQQVQKYKSIQMMNVKKLWEEVKKKPVTIEELMRIADRS
jgi:DNA-binding Xre family transcriptional regulator